MEEEVRYVLFRTLEHYWVDKIFLKSLLLPVSNATHLDQSTLDQRSLVSRLPNSPKKHEYLAHFLCCLKFVDVTFKSPLLSTTGPCISTLQNQAQIPVPLFQWNGQQVLRDFICHCKTSLHICFVCKIQLAIYLLSLGPILKIFVCPALLMQ